MSKEPYLPKGVTRHQQRDFATELNNVRDKAMRLGLLATGQKLDLAVKQVGYELAGTPELMEKMERIRSRPFKKPKVCTCSARFVSFARQASHAKNCELVR